MINTPCGVTTIYASNVDPEALGEGFEIKVARGPSGCVESVAIFDFDEGEMLEVPIEVALLFAETLKGVQERPLAPAPQSATFVFISDEVPGLGQDGYLITLLRDRADVVESLILADANEDVEITCDPATAYAMADAIESLDAFPADRLH